MTTRTNTLPTMGSIRRNVRVVATDNGWDAYHDGYQVHARARTRTQARERVVQQVMAIFATATK